MIDHPDLPPAAIIEFDAYSARHSAGSSSSGKGLLGDSADEFVAVKIDWLVRHFPALCARGRDRPILDRSHGTATLLGCDILAGKLARTRRGWSTYLMFAPPRFRSLAPVERLLGWLPLGGQYATIAGC